LTSNDIVVTIASDAEAILKRLGILMSTAVDMFLNQVVLVGGITIWKLIHFYILF
jgi:antitoxin component of RelBE/YafQ-DinJ toxin-antitoxin module